MELDHLLNNIEKELKKRLNYPYHWGRKQCTSWDKRTRFIHEVNQFDKLLAEIEFLFYGDTEYQQLRNYTMNRWYNFWSAHAIEMIFSYHKNVEKEKNKYHKTIDFYIEEIPFDHKTSVFPNSFKRNISQAINNKKMLIRWFYENQSQQSRKHLANRLFLVLYNTKDQHWKLKSEIFWIKNIIDGYLISFDEKNLISMKLEGKLFVSDIIWGIK